MPDAGYSYDKGEGTGKVEIQRLTCGSTSPASIRQLYSSYPSAPLKNISTMGPFLQVSVCGDAASDHWGFYCSCAPVVCTCIQVCHVPAGVLNISLHYTAFGVCMRSWYTAMEYTCIQVSHVPAGVLNVPLHYTDLVYVTAVYIRTSNTSTGSVEHRFSLTMPLVIAMWVKCYEVQPCPCRAAVSGNRITVIG